MKDINICVRYSTLVGTFIYIYDQILAPPPPPFFKLENFSSLQKLGI